MSQQLIYIMGPSGAGKDSLLAWLKQQLPSSAPIHWAKRTINRPLQAGGEPYESVDNSQFAQLIRQNAFILHWQANGLSYGIRQPELAPLYRGQWVLLNGSRAYLSQARQAFPRLTLLHITTSPDTLRQRLLARGRESPQQIEARLERTRRWALQTPIADIEIHNDSTLEQGGQALLQSLQQLSNWPLITHKQIATVNS
ncbi:phosphonate metabolism protein/1,5-bisphosphokinase (PRPP-forming) PhnN [Neisseriaceae bacterium TC5R-5]|nr:phosphonate metabolism protein/1,5-bisphosphokinase (PRPP-forming) PhnN [Neisseriaceae bacterium TC5R-5]